jgi:hypothetical protein
MKTELIIEGKVTIKEKLTKLLDIVLENKKIGVLDQSMQALNILDRLIEIERCMPAKPKQEAKQPIAEEVTYSIGDRFKSPSDERKWLLTFSDTNRVIFVDMASGLWANGSHRVADKYRITAKELASIRGTRMVRTWDSSNQCDC